MVIAFKLHKTPVAADVLLLPLLGRLSFVLDEAHLPTRKTSHLYRHAEPKALNLDGEVEPVHVPLGLLSRLDATFCSKTVGLFLLLWLASRSVDDAYFENAGSIPSKKLRLNRVEL